MQEEQNKALGATNGVMPCQVDPATSWPYTLMNIYEVLGGEKTLIAIGIISSGIQPSPFKANIEYWYPQVQTYATSNNRNLLLERKYSDTTNLDPTAAVLIRGDKVHWDKAVSISPDFTSTYQHNGLAVAFGFTLDIAKDSNQGQTMTLIWFNSTPSNLMTGVTETLTCAQAAVDVATWYCAQ
jgi:hypothetical protein